MSCGGRQYFERKVGGNVMWDAVGANFNFTLALITVYDVINNYQFWHLFN